MGTLFLNVYMTIIFIILKSLFVPAFSPLVIGLIRKIKAKMQNRQGASIIQPYFDLIKMFKKDEVISKDASWIFKFSPYLIFTISIVISIGIPILTTFNLLPAVSDFLVIIYLLSLMTFFLALSGIDVGSAFGGFGSSREMTLTAITEGALVFSLLSPAFLTQTTNVMTIASKIVNTDSSIYFPLILAFIAFVAVLLAENKRFPFDNPATHLELTMVHEAMILEYSGKRLALLEWASYNKLLIFIALGTNIFYPWTLATNLATSALLFSFLALAIKVLVVALFVALLESLIAKYRYFRLPDILLTAFILSVLSLIAVSI